MLLYRESVLGWVKHPSRSVRAYGDLHGEIGHAESAISDESPPSAMRAAAQLLERPSNDIHRKRISDRLADRGGELER